jgi:hypothetical protein
VIIRSFPGVGGVEVDELADPVGGQVGGAGDDHAAVAVAHEDHVVQPLVVQDGGDIAGVEVEVDGRADEVRPLAEAGQRRRVHLVAGGPQEPGHALVAPAAVPPAVHQYVRRHIPSGLPVPSPRVAVLLADSLLLHSWHGSIRP